MLILLFFVLFILFFQKSFQLKRGKYLVVGNCANCWPRNLKHIVKEFDGTVILFNNNKHFENLNQNTIVLCNSARKKKLLGKPLTRFPLVFVDAFNNDLLSSSLLNGVYSMLYCFLRNKTVSFMKLNEIDLPSASLRGRPEGARPTTGFMVVEKLVSIGSEVYVTGFDPNDQSIHGPNDKRHNLHRESEIMNEWKSNKFIIEI